MTEDLHRQIYSQLLSAGGRPLDREAVTATAVEMNPLLERSELDSIVRKVLANAHGLGPLDELLHDESVSDVLVVGGKGVWIERDGVLEDAGLVLEVAEVERLIERTVAPLGLRVDRSSPLVDARLPDGSRVNAIVAPIAVDGPCLTIRRFLRSVVPIENFASELVVRLLQAAVSNRRNILVSGGTGAGKTTLLNSLAASIGAAERVITIEDTAELRLPLRHVVRLEARPANSEGVGRVTVRDLVRNALRMRPDRIVVGEVRGPEVLDMLQAMNTGHEGSMSTCHANSPQDALHRLETMALLDGTSLPLHAVRSQIFAAIDLVVQVARCEGGVRRVLEVAEVTGSPTKPTTSTLVDRETVLPGPGRTMRPRR